MKSKILKAKEVNIISISVNPDHAGVIYGLGNDNKVYMYLSKMKDWQLFGSDLGEATITYPGFPI
jgi:hypothetical protein